MALTLTQVKSDPDLITFTVPLDGGQTALLRPLLPQDAPLLAQFLSGLSLQTRRFYVVDSYDLRTATEYCEAIARYDKLRLIAVHDDEMIALLEFSFFLTSGDRERYQQHGIALEPGSVCRFGPCIADRYQGRGLGTLLFPYLITVARQFGQSKIILWGGVFAENQKTVRYYQKLGFQTAGSFLNQDGLACIDMILDIE